MLDSQGAVLTERLSEAAPPTTEYLGSVQWRTEYMFDLPGALYQAGNQLVHVIDPNDELSETDEGDNVGEPIRLYGVELAPFRITFVPLHYPGEEAPFIEPAALLANPLAVWPIADDFQAKNAAPVGQTVGEPRCNPRSAIQPSTGTRQAIPGSDSAGGMGPFGQPVPQCRRGALFNPITQHRFDRFDPDLTKSGRIIQFRPLVRGDCVLR